MMRQIQINRSMRQMVTKGSATRFAPTHARTVCIHPIQYRFMSGSSKDAHYEAKINHSPKTSPGQDATLYEKVFAAVDSATETKAHKMGRTSAEAVTEAVSGAAKVVNDAVTPKVKAMGEVAYEGVTGAATQVKDAANHAMEQAKQAMSTKSVSEKITDTAKGAAAQVGEFYEGAKDAVNNAVHPKK